MNIALKIIRFGNSVGVIIPKEMLSKLRVDLGGSDRFDRTIGRLHNPTA